MAVGALAALADHSRFDVIGVLPCPSDDLDELAFPSLTGPLRSEASPPRFGRSTSSPRSGAPAGPRPYRLRLLRSNLPRAHDLAAPARHPEPAFRVAAGVSRQPTDAVGDDQRRRARYDAAPVDAGIDSGDIIARLPVPPVPTKRWATYTTGPPASASTCCCASCRAWSMA